MKNPTSPHHHNGKPELEQHIHAYNPQLPPRVVPEAPPVPLRSDLTRTMSKSDPSEELRGATTPRAGELTRRTCVCYASFRPLRSFTLQCTRKWSVVEGEGA